MKKYLILLCSVMVFTGCSTIKPGNDPLIVRTEQTLSIARDTIDSFLLLEYQNHAILKDKLPELEIVAADFVADKNGNNRADALDWLDSLNNVKLAYKEKKDSRDSLIRALAVVEKALYEAQKYLVYIDQTILKK